jgi:hypothetical protein
MREVYIVASFAEVGGAWDACVSILDVKSTRIASIPIEKMFHQNGVWRHVNVLLAPLCWVEVPLPSCEDIACRESTTGRECPDTAKH